MSKTFELSPSSLSMSQDVEAAIIGGKTLCTFATEKAHSESTFFFAVLHAAHHDGILSRMSLDGSKRTTESRVALKAWRIAQGVIADSPRDELSRVIRLAVVVLANGEHDWRNAASRKDLAAMANDKAVEVISTTESAIQGAERLARSEAAQAAAQAAETAQAAAKAAADQAAAAAEAQAATEKAFRDQIAENEMLRSELAAVRETLTAVRAELATATANGAPKAKRTKAKVSA